MMRIQLSADRKSMHGMQKLGAGQYQTNTDFFRIYNLLYRGGCSGTKWLPCITVEGVLVQNGCHAFPWWLLHIDGGWKVFLPHHCEVFLSVIKALFKCNNNNKHV